MKKGFTMIELIFVIVILGILAAVAIPKLNATRDDAEEVKLKTNISTIITDFASYYTSKGAFGTTSGTTFTAADLTEITNVPLTISNTAGVMKVKGVDCIEFEIQSASAIKITPKGTTAGGICKKVLDKSDVQAMLIGKAAWNANDGVNGDAVKDGATVRYMDFGASGVTW